MEVLKIVFGMSFEVILLFLQLHIKCIYRKLQKMITQSF